MVSWLEDEPVEDAPQLNKLRDQVDAGPTDVVRSTHDMFAGSQVETGDDLG